MHLRVSLHDIRETPSVWPGLVKSGCRDSNDRVRPIQTPSSDGNSVLVAETVLYDHETKRSVAIVRADLTEGGMKNVRLSPPPGAEAAGTVPAWQMDIFQRPDLAKSLREKARSYLR